MAEISMPHRYLVRWQDGPLRADYEVEALSEGVLFYASDPTVSGGDGLPASAAQQVETWLRSRFSRVDVDHSPKPTF